MYAGVKLSEGSITGWPADFAVAVAPACCKTVNDRSEPVTASQLRVATCLDSLQADFERQSRRISLDDINQAILSRRLEPLEAADVWNCAFTNYAPYCETALSKNSLPEGTGFLTPPEERTLTRRVSALRLAEEAEKRGAK